ncbi:MAG: hypothetical protein ACOCR1_00745 [Planctomycetota bacterium]
MKCPAKFLAILSVGLIAASTVLAEPTELSVYVKSQGAKFVGSSMGGARIVIRDARSGKLLSTGRTKGSTGDTDLIMKGAREPATKIVTPETAHFRTTVDINRPRLVEITAYGPVAQQQAAVTVSRQQWLLPGKDIVKGNAITLTLPGFAVDVQAPSNHVKLEGAPQTINIEANVTMMCGCGIEPDGLWDPNDYEIQVTIHKKGAEARTKDMKYAGATSQFEREITLEDTGLYEITVTAFDPTDGNTGVDQSTVIVRAE